MSALCEKGLGTTRPEIPETASKYETADRPETTAALLASQEIAVESNRNSTTPAEPSPPPQ